MSRKKRPNIALKKEIFHNLSQKGYMILDEFTPYHARIGHEDSIHTIELWATAGKAMQSGAHTVFQFKDWRTFERWMMEVLY